MGKYFAPAFQVTVNGNRLSADVSKNIESVTVTSKPDTIDSFTLTLANALPTLRWTHTDDRELFQEGNLVKVNMGYVDDMQLMIVGEIITIQPSFPAGGVPTVTIGGQSLLHRLQGDTNTRSFQNQKDQDIAVLVGHGVNLKVDAEDTGPQLEASVTQTNETDLKFLQRRAANLHFEILMPETTLIYRKVRVSAPKVYTLLWAQVQKSLASGPEALPLKSFNYTLNIKKPAGKVEYRAYDIKAKQAFVVSADEHDQISKMGGARSGAEVAAAALKHEVKRVSVSLPFASQQEGQQLAIGAYNEDAMETVTGHAETIGIPDMRAGGIVDLQGVGKRFSGQYRLEEVTHTIDANGYGTSFSVNRNGTS